ncbi:MAG: hypothetical protein IPH88_05550 [Bacteroidales bacterium]|nr:hypothetical protein [Bacteroidales bacterium]
MKAFSFVLMLFLFLSILASGQPGGDIDPYYNGHLKDKYDPAQVDFSSEYLKLQLKSFSNAENRLEEAADYDFSPVWFFGNWHQNGVIGPKYQRIMFHIDLAVKSAVDPNSYLVSGKSRVKDNTCDFKGEIKLLKVFLFDSCMESEYKNCGELFASYTFYEDSTQYHSGIFKGVTEAIIYLDKLANTVNIDESNGIADGYWNRSFVGTWTDYKTHLAQKCIWGDYRLPFTFDFDGGDGEMHVCEKYINNGWQTFGDGSEVIEVGKDMYEIKDKWWLTKE